MSDVVDIKELKKKFEEKVKTSDLQEFAETQQILIERLLTENGHLKDKLKHAEGVLKALQMSGPTVMSLTPEELICIEQINVLHNRSSQRELTLDEVKRLDILVKNLRLIREMSTQVIESVGHRDVKEADLVAIVHAANLTEDK